MFVPGLIPVFQSSVSPSNSGRVCVWLGVILLHIHRAIIWCAFGVAWLYSMGAWLFERLMCFRTVMQVFVLFACKQMTHSVANVPSQQAVKLVL